MHQLPTLEEYMNSIIAPLLRSSSPPLYTQIQDSLGILLVLQVDKQDIAILIGAQGKTISAIRTLLRAYGAQKKISVSLKIIEKQV